MTTSSEIKKLADQLFPDVKELDEPEVKNIPPQQRRLHTETADYTVSTLFSLLTKEKKLRYLIFKGAMYGTEVKLPA